MLCLDDPENSDPSKDVAIAVRTKKLVPGTSNLDRTTGWGAETVKQTTLGAAGIVIMTDIPITTADLGTGVAAGDWLMVRLRRVGSNANDNHRGNALVIGVEVRDT